MRFVAGLCAVVMLAGCSVAQRLLHPPARYIDLRFVTKGSAQHYPYAIDQSGVLWYIEGSEVIRQTSPARRDAVHDPGAVSGTIFAYDRAVYVLDGDGASLTRFDGKQQTDITIPAQFVPAEGAIADARHRWVVFAQSAPHQLAMIDAWRWYAERLPQRIAAFASTLAGGPHGKKYLVAGDEHLAEIAIKDRWNGRSVLVSLPPNTCFPQGGTSWTVPVDVRGRDGYRAWASSGQHVVSVDLATKHRERVWDLDGCAMRLVGAGADRAVAMVATRDKDRFVAALVQIDRDGVHPLAQYGQIEGIPVGAVLDSYDRLWWYDRKLRAFICRTPLS